MSADPLGLTRSFLAENGRDPAFTVEALKPLEPLFQEIRRKRYPLRPESEFDTAAGLSVLSDVTGRTVGQIVLLSAAAPLGKPRWMAEAAYWRCLPESLGPGIRSAVEIAYGDALWRRPPGPEWSGFCEVFETAVARPLAAAVRHSLPEVFQFRVIEGIRSALQYYLAFVMTGDRLHAARLQPLIGLLSRATPLGEKIDEPGTWLVLVA